MKTRTLIRATLPILLLFVSTAAFAQRGGKAEPLRIEIRRGATSAKVKNKIRGDEQAEYVFAARKGQRIKISLFSAPAQSAVFELRRAPEADSQIEYSGRNWSGVAPETGDYFVNVIRQKGAAAASRYTLTLTIR